MRYLDSSRRDPDQTLGYWLNVLLGEEVAELRWQTGFFRAEVLRWFVPALRGLRARDGLARVLVGSNGGDTTDADVRELIRALGLPRRWAALGVVAYTGGLFHPKTLHIRFVNGHEAAYVGSSNLTGAGVSGMNVEAGYLFDTRSGDDPANFADVAERIDAWFLDPPPPGFYRVTSDDDVTQLVTTGVLADASIPLESVLERTPRASGGLAHSLPRPSLRPLVQPPEPRRTTPTTPTRTRRATSVPPGATGAARPIETREADYYPDYLKFAAGLTAPTSGAHGLTGQSLPAGAVGLIVKLNRDSARQFEGRGGTCNISTPVETLNTLRFGIYQSMRRNDLSRPRVEFPLTMWFLADGLVIGPVDSNTSIMGYGFHPNESGHGDVRLLVPADVRLFVDPIERSGATLPGVGSFAWLHWPTDHAPRVTLVFLEPRSPAHEESRIAYEHAETTGRLVGQGACWLLPALFARYSPSLRT
jgi:hypothetical protein